MIDGCPLLRPSPMPSARERPALPPACFRSRSTSSPSFLDLVRTLEKPASTSSSARTWMTTSFSTVSPLHVDHRDDRRVLSIDRRWEALEPVAEIEGVERIRQFSRSGYNASIGIDSSADGAVLIDPSSKGAETPVAAR